MGARLDVDDLVELKVELDDLGRRLRAASIAVGELIAQQGMPSPTATGTAGLPCAGEFSLNAQPEIATHCVAPLDNASLHDEPPSRPA